jgi:hypothetical protein
MSIVLVALLASASPSCKDIERMPVVVHFTPAVARPGVSLGFRVDYMDGPNGPQPVPAACLSSWRAEGKGVRVDKAKQMLVIGADAAVGTTATLGFKIANHRYYEGLTVHGADEGVLQGGRWLRSSDATCASFPYSELVFGSRGGLTYTSPEHMVETMSDGTVDYQWLPETSTISASIFPGGSVKVALDGDTLSFRLLDAVDENSQVTSYCDLVFTRDTK